MKHYQTHDDNAGASDSALKLERLKLPADLTGKRVLDLGCNEGFFCGEAARRGARDVVGLDASEEALVFARERYPDERISFLRQNWRTIPQGPFDIVMWLSAMHYERDPASVFATLKTVLAPGGLVILECGVHPDQSLDFLVPTQRPADKRFYPSMTMLRRWLRGWSVKRVARPELTSGDPIPRAVFHCTPAKVTVLLITGTSAKGKSSLAALVRPQATKTIPLDTFLFSMKHGALHTSPLAAFVKENAQSNNLEAFFRKIDEAGFTDEYIDLLTFSIAPSDEFVVVEGFMTDTQRDALKAKLRNIAFIWEAARS